MQKSHDVSQNYALEYDNNDEMNISMAHYDVGYFRNDDYDKMNMNEMKMMRIRVIYMFMRIVF